jgi:hypothetical protein
MSDLEAHALSIAQCDKILSEITEGDEMNVLYSGAR